MARAVTQEEFERISNQQSPQSRRARAVSQEEFNQIIRGGVQASPPTAEDSPFSSGLSQGLRQVGTTLFGTLPEAAGQKAVTPDLVPQRSMHDFAYVPPSAPSAQSTMGQPSIADFIPSGPTQYGRPANPVSPERLLTPQNPAAGATQAAREFFQPDRPDLQATGTLRPENTPYLDFSGNTPFSQKLNRLKYEIGSQLPNLGATIGAGLVAGPGAAGVVGGGLEGLSLYDKVIQEGGTPEEAMRAGVSMGVGAGVLNALPFAHAVTKFLPETVAARVLIGAPIRGLVFEGPTEMLEEGWQTFAERKEAPKNAEEWKQAFADAAQATWNARSVYAVSALMGTAGAVQQGRVEGKQGEARAKLLGELQAGADAFLADYEAAKRGDYNQTVPTFMDVLASEMKRQSSERQTTGLGIPQPPTQAELDAEIDSLPRGPVTNQQRRAVEQDQANIDAAVDSVNQRVRGREAIARAQQRVNSGIEPIFPLQPEIDPAGYQRPPTQQSMRGSGVGPLTTAPIPAQDRPLTREEVEQFIAQMERDIARRGQSTPLDPMGASPSALGLPPGTDIRPERAPVPVLPDRWRGNVQREAAPSLPNPMPLVGESPSRRLIADANAPTVQPFIGERPIQTPEDRMTMPGVPTGIGVEPLSPQEQADKTPAQRLADERRAKRLAAPVPEEPNANLEEISTKLEDGGNTGTVSDDLKKARLAFHNWDTLVNGHILRGRKVPKGQEIALENSREKLEKLLDRDMPDATPEERAAFIDGGAPPKAPRVMTEDEYLASNGASRQGIGEPALHKNIQNGRAKRQMIERQARLDRELIEKRDTLRDEYQAKVESGEIRQPTRQEKLERVAQGHPDNEATQAARRLLEKKARKGPPVAQQEGATFSPETQAIVSAYGSPSKALSVLRGQKGQAQKNSEPVSPETTRAIEELTLGGKAQSSSSSSSQGELFGQSEIAVSPGSQTELIVEEIKPEHIDITNEQLAEFRRRVRQIKVSAPKGAMTWEDLGFNETRPPVAKKGTGKSWDLWLEEAYNLGLISEQERSEPSVLADLIKGRNREKLQVSEGGMFMPGAKALSNEKQAGGVFSVSDILVQSGLAKKSEDARAYAAESAVKSIVGGSSGTRASISDIRDNMPGLTREQQDQALRQAQTEGRIVLVKNDDPTTVSERDRENVLMIGDDPRYGAYYQLPQNRRQAKPNTPKADPEPQAAAPDAAFDALKARFESGEITVADFTKERKKLMKAKKKGEAGYINLGALADAPGAIREKTKEILDTLKTEDGARLTFDKGLGRPLHKLKVRMQGSINAHLTEAAQANKDFTKAVKSIYGKEANMPEAVAVAASDVLQGKASASILPEPLRAPIAEMRHQIDTLSRSLIRSGMLDEKMQTVFENNIGAYARRTFKAFNDPNWAKQMPEPVRNRMYSFLKSEHPEWTDNNIKQHMFEILEEAKRSGSALEGLAQGRILGSVNRDTLRQRKDLPTELLEFLGEEKDAGLNFLESVQSMANMLSKYQFLSQAREEGLGSIFFEKNDPNIPEQTIEITSANNKALAPLAGLRADPALIDALQEAVDPKSLHGIMAALASMNGVAKMSKTAGSVKTQIRNYSTNILLGFANGHFMGNPVTVGEDFREAHRLATVGLSSGGTKEQRAAYNRATSLGVTQDSNTVGELRDIRRRTRASNKAGELADKLSPKIREQWNSKTAMALDLYQAGDDVWKLFGWLRETRTLMDTQGLSREQAEEQAAEIVRAQQPTYSEVPKFVQGVRRSLVTGPFTGFVSEIPRISINLAARIQYEWRHENPKVSAHGKKRAAAALASVVLPASIAAATAMRLGMDKEDREDVQRFAAPWMRNSTLAYHDADRAAGKFTVVDLGYVDPFGVIRQPIHAAMRGEDPVDGALELAKAFIEPYVASELFLGAVYEVATTARGEAGDKAVWDDSDPPDEKFLKGFGRLWEAVEPGTVTDIRRGYRNGEMPKELSAMGTGVRFSDIDIPENMKFRTIEWKKVTPNAMKDVYSAVKGGSMSAVEEQIDQMEAERKEAWAELVEDRYAAERLGVPKRTIYQSLLSGGMDEREAKLLLKGKYQAYRIPAPLRRKINGLK